MKIKQSWHWIWIVHFTQIVEIWFLIYGLNPSIISISHTLRKTNRYWRQHRHWQAGPISQEEFTTIEVKACIRNYILLNTRSVPRAQTPGAPSLRCVSHMWNTPNTRWNTLIVPCPAKFRENTFTRFFRIVGNRDTENRKSNSISKGLNSTSPKYSILCLYFDRPKFSQAWNRLVCFCVESDESWKCRKNTFTRFP